MKKLLMIACVAMLATIACNKDNPPPPPEVQLPDVTITGPAIVLPGEKGAFTATLSKEAEGVVKIKLTNANPALLMLAAEEIIIEEGKASGTVDFKWSKDANGVRVKVSFTSVDAIIKTSELNVEIPLWDPPFVFGDYPNFENGTFSAISKIVIGDQTIESSAANAPDGPNKRLAGHDDFGIGGVSDDKKNSPISLTDGIAYTIYYDNFTADDGIEMAVALYINWNGDFDYADAGEEVIVEKGIPANAKKEISGTITLPADAVKSATIRVMCYAVEGSNMKGGVGDADSGSLMELMYAK